MNQPSRRPWASVLRGAFPALLACVLPVSTASAFQFLGSYHNGLDFDSLDGRRQDAVIDFDWGLASPHPELAEDEVSIRWTGRVMPAFTEDYTLHITADDGVRVWVDGALVIDHWVVTAAVESSGIVALEAGRAADLVVEYFDAGGFASCRLEWSSPSQPRVVIPASTPVEPFQPFYGGVFPATKPGQGGVDAMAATDGLGIGMLLSITSRPGSRLLFAGSRDGRIVAVDPQGPSSSGTPYLDISDRVWTGQDSGLLGVAFHPEFDTGASPFRGRLFLYYVHGMGGSQFLRLSRFQVADGETLPDPASEVILIQQRLGPTLHRGGGLLFGNDGLLYLSIGDLGYRDDAQALTDFFNSSVLRLDVDEDPARSHPIAVPIYPGDPESFTANYSIPNDNPFIGAVPGALEEVFALGLRNPHRMTLDPVSGAILIGDVGSNTDSSQEEVNVLQSGANYGWDFRESDGDLGTPPTTVYGTLVDPVVSYPRSQGACVIGGFIYRGKAIPWLVGRYVFGDYTNNEIRFTQNAQLDGPIEPLTTAPAGLVTFGVDNDGEIYLSGGDSVVYRLEPTSFSPEPPATLSATGVFADLATLEPVPPFRPYEVASPLYSDGALKRRWFAVPNDGLADDAGERIGFDPTGAWSFPQGSVFIKHFALPLGGGGERPLETRFLAHGADGRYYGVTYRWRADGSDADLLTEGESDLIEGQVWDFPSRADCNRCHNPTAGSVLGMRTSQLNLEPDDGGGVHQVALLDHAGLLDPPLEPGTLAGLPRMAPIDDMQAFLQQRGRAYLQANCAHCHLPDGPGRGEFDARFETPFGAQGLVDGPVAEDFGVDGARVFVPRDLARTQLYHRLDTLSLGAMPPLAKNVVDERAAELIAAWVEVANDPAVDFSAEYYQGQNFESLVLQRGDPVIDFDWGAGAPDPLVGSDDFSVRWTGMVAPAVTETYTFHTTTDDGARLWVDGQLLIDDWTPHPPQERTGTIDLVAGELYPVTMEFFEAGGGAVARLEWSSASQARGLVVPVAPDNTEPVAFPQTLQVAVNGASPLTLAGTDAEQVGLDVAITRLPEFGELSGLGKELVYTPQPDYAGPDAFTFVLSDGSRVSEEAQVTISVECPYDCDGDGLPDDCSADCDGDGLPDTCEPDCDGNGIPDECEAFLDCNGSGVPDRCELAGNDCDANGIPDDCQDAPDCNANGIPDACDVATGGSADSDGNGVPDECEFLGSVYCVGAPNSAGSGASLRALGSSEVAANGLQLRSEGLPAEVPGMHFFGPQQVQVPFGDGFRCVGGATIRIRPVSRSDRAGVVDRAIDLTAPAFEAVTPGTEWNFQFWYRDPAGPGGSGFNLTNGVNLPFE